MRILLAGVPFGCENVGDEAILECAVGIFREVFPGAHLTASTGDPERTAARLGIETCRLLGFFNDVSPEETRSIIGAHDVFVWCGATGLSDYPLVTPVLMRVAQSLGKKTLLWGVGMNDALNPVFHKVQPGRYSKLLRLATLATLGLVDAIRIEEKRRDTRSRAAIAECLNAADLVILRDTQSRGEVIRSGVTREVHVGSDSAILLQADSLEGMALAPGVMEMLQSDGPKIGLCVSAQSAIKKERELAQCLDELAAGTGAHIVAIPMNPLTDSALMARLVGRMLHRERVTVLTGEYQPGEILAVASRMSVVVSSRLHLLILSAVAGIPIVGIARGSKVDNFLDHFGLAPVGSVDECDFTALQGEVKRLLESPEAYRARAVAVQSEGLARLESAKVLLKAALSGIQ